MSGGHAMAMLDQQAVFAERIGRIAAGRQFEHEDLVGYQTQTAYNRRAARVAKRPKAGFSGRIMKMVALAAGAGSVVLGKMAYFHLSQVQGLPKSFYDLEMRGMVLATLLTAAILTAVLRLNVQGRLALVVMGLAAMFYGEGLVALAQPGLWGALFSPEYASEMAASGRAILMNTATAG